MVFEDDRTGSGVDAVLTQTFNMAVIFSSATEGLGTWGYVQTYAGHDCDGLICDFQVEALVAHAG